MDALVNTRARVLVITTAHNPLDVRIFRKQATSLAAAGYSVTLMAPFSPGAAEEAAEVGVILLPLSASSGRINRIMRLGSVARHLVRSRSSFDVWHFHDPEMLLVCPTLRRLAARKVRVVYDVHEDYPAALRSREWIPRPLRRFAAGLTAWVEATISRDIPLVVAATPTIAAKFQETARRTTITVMNYPIATDAEQPPATESEQRAGNVSRCVFVGGITEVRGVHEMVEAMRGLDPQRYELVLAGPFETTELEHEITSSAPENVRWLGVLPYPSVHQLLLTSDIGLVCFLPEPNHVDSMPTKLFEYLAAGLPVIASDFPSWNQFVEDRGVGIQVSPTDSSAIREAIRTLSADPARRKRMGQVGQELATSTFVWQFEADKLVQAYSLLLE